MMITILSQIRGTKQWQTGGKAYSYMFKPSLKKNVDKGLEDIDILQQTNKQKAKKTRMKRDATLLSFDQRSSFTQSTTHLPKTFQSIPDC